MLTVNQYSLFAQYLLICCIPALILQKVLSLLKTVNDRLRN